MFILSQAIIPVFVFAVLVNFYNFDPIFSIHVPVNFTNCQDCIASPCHNTDNGSCTLNADNSTIQCFTCPEQDGNKQYFLEADCQKQCNDPAKCACDGKCYMCVQNTQTDASKFTCEMPTLKWDNECKTVVSYQPPAAPPAP